MQDWSTGVGDSPVTRFDPIDVAIDAIERGGMIVVVDDNDPENVASLVLAADAVTPEAIAFFVRHTSGVIIAPITELRARELGLEPVASQFNDRNGETFTQSVDYRHGDATAVSAEGRALTIQALIDCRTRPSDLSRPGHIFPVEVHDAGVLGRRGHAEAGVDMSRLAGRAAGAVVCELVDDNGTLAHLETAAAFAATNGLPVVSVADLVQHRYRTEQLVEHLAAANMPTDQGDFVCHAYRSTLDGEQHMALVYGDLTSVDAPVVRFHSECLTGDVFGSRRCDCGMQVDLALERIAAEGAGVLVYLRGHEGRGIGLGHKIQAYRLQDEGADTVDANLLLGLPVDSREYTVAVSILAHLGVRRVRVLTNNPAKVSGIVGLGIEVVDREAIQAEPDAKNFTYLRTKQERMGHLLDLTDDGHRV